MKYTKDLNNFADLAKENQIREFPNSTEPYVFEGKSKGLWPFRNVIKAEVK